MSNRLLNFGYLALQIGLALHTWLAWSGSQLLYKNEVLIVGSITAYIIAFPASAAYGAFYGALVFGVSHIVTIDEWRLGSAFVGWVITVWIPLFILGYVQWFILVPMLLKRLRSKLRVLCRR